MSDIALPGSIEPAQGPKLDQGMNPLTGILFLGVLAAGILVRRLQHLQRHWRRLAQRSPAILPFLLLFVALLIALGFEFVNGFHDTANAVATVIYTRSLPANIAVVWSGMFNLARRVVVVRRGRVRHRLAAPCRADPAGRQQRRFCHGFRAVDRGDHLESRHLVFWPSGIELAYADRIGHRRRRGQCAAAWPQRYIGRRLGQGDLDRQGIAVLADLWLLPGSGSAGVGEVPDPQTPGALFRAEGRPAAADLDPRHSGVDLHAGELLPRFQRRSEGHGPDHADPDRYGADRLCAQSRHAGEPDGAVRGEFGGRKQRSSHPKPPATMCSAIRGRP